MLCLHTVQNNANEVFFPYKKFLKALTDFPASYVVRGRSGTQTDKITRLHLQPASLLPSFSQFPRPATAPTAAPAHLPRRIFSLPQVLGHHGVNLQSTAWIKISQEP